MQDAVAATVQRITALLDFRRVEEARELAAKALETEPDSDALWAALAFVEKAREDFAAAIVAGERALAIEPTNSSALHTLVEAYAQTDRRAQARATADTLVSLYPEWPNALAQHGYVYSLWNGTIMPSDANKRTAMASLERAVELAPEDATLLSDAARFYASLSEGVRARALMERALELAPNDDRIILASKIFATEQQAVERDLAVLANNPMSIEAKADFDARLWSRFRWFAGIPLWIAGLTLVIAHLFYDAGDGTRWVIAMVALFTTVFALSYLRRSRRVIPRDMLRMAVAQNRLVVPAMILTVLSSLATLATVAVLVYAPVTRGDRLFQDAASCLILVILLQFLAAFAIEWTIARVDLQSMRFDDTPAGKRALKRQAQTAGGGVAGVLLAPAIVVISIISSEHTSTVGVLALAVLLIAWSLAEFGVNNYRRSHAYPTLWFAVVLLLIAAAAYALGAWLTAYQLLGLTF